MIRASANPTTGSGVGIRDWADSDPAEEAGPIF
jgi:hypothetical protein